jgi:hypothetical protein
MSCYNLQRVSDQQLFSSPAGSDDEALAKFGKEVGETLTFEGDGPPAYLLGCRSTSQGWIEVHVPVYVAGSRIAECTARRDE